MLTCFSEPPDIKEIRETNGVESFVADHALEVGGCGEEGDALGFLGHHGHAGGLSDGLRHECRASCYLIKYGDDV